MTTSSRPSRLHYRRFSEHRHRRRAGPSKPSDPGPGAAKRLKVDQPEDLLALIPYLLGFRPAESLVMLVIADRIVKVTVRVDLVDDVTGVAQRFGAIAVSNRATGVVLIAYSADPARADAMLLPVMDKLASLRVIEALYTDGRRWWSRSCSDDCCPAEGTPYEIASNKLAAAAVFHGMSSYGDRSDLQRLTAGPPEPDEPALRRLADTLVGPVLAPKAADRRRRMRELVSDYVQRRKRGDRVTLSDRELVTLALLTLDLPVRDEAWVAIDRQDAWIHAELWQQVVARTVPDLAPGPLCLLGMASWIEGQGALQVCCIDRLTRLAPDYSMARLLAGLNEQAIPPSAWDQLKDNLSGVLDEMDGPVGGGQT